MQALLAERFQLAIHRERKEQPVLALVVGSSGLKLSGPPANAEAPLPDGPADHAVYTPQGEARQTENGDLVVKSGVYGPMRGGRGASGGMRWEFLKLSMPALAALLTPHVDRPVIDQTHLPGSYALTFENRPVSESGGGRKGSEPPELGRETGRQPDPFGEGLLRAIGKAGLKLEARRAPVETIVVDRLEKAPSGN